MNAAMQKLLGGRAGAINLALLAGLLLVVFPLLLEPFRLNLMGKYLSYAFVAVGLVLGLLSSLAVVPVLVGGDGHPQVPRVLVTLPAGKLVAFAVVVALVLSAVGVLVLRGTGRDISAELRRGEAS